MLHDFLTRANEAQTQLSEHEIAALADYVREHSDRMEEDMTPFSPEERRRLAFLRWLNTEGRLAA